MKLFHNSTSCGCGQVEHDYYGVGIRSHDWSHDQSCEYNVGYTHHRLHVIESDVFLKHHLVERANEES